MMTPYIVVDASIAGAWLFNEVYSAQAQSVLDAIVHRRVIALVPDRFEEELLRICQKKLLPPPSGAGISEKDSFNRFLELMTAPVPMYRMPSQDLHERAWQMAVATAGLTTHDALYLALAERWDAELWTTDGVLGSPAVRTYANISDLRTRQFTY